MQQVFTLLFLFMAFSSFAQSTDNGHQATKRPSVYRYEIKVPKGVKEEWFADRVRFLGTKDELYHFLGEFGKLKELKDGDCVKLSSLTLKVSDYITDDRYNEHWVELPGHAWGIMSSKFYDVWGGFDGNPFDFNDCGYLDEIPFDIGIEITDMPLSDAVVFQSDFITAYKSEWDGIYILVEDTELFKFLEARLIEQGEIHIKSHQHSKIDQVDRYRIFVDSEQETALLKLLNAIDTDELEGIWKHNDD